MLTPDDDVGKKKPCNHPLFTLLHSAAAYVSFALSANLWSLSAQFGLINTERAAACRP